MIRRLLCWLNLGHLPKSRVYWEDGDQVVELSCDCGLVVENRIVFPFSLLAKKKP